MVYKLCPMKRTPPLEKGLRLTDQRAELIIITTTIPRKLIVPENLLCTESFH